MPTASQAYRSERRTHLRRGRIHRHRAVLSGPGRGSAERRTRLSFRSRRDRDTGAWPDHGHGRGRIRPDCRTRTPAEAMSELVVGSGAVISYAFSDLFPWIGLQYIAF